MPADHDVVVSSFTPKETFTYAPSLTRWRRGPHYRDMISACGREVLPELRAS